jgi:outer membrane protein N
MRTVVLFALVFVAGSSATIAHAQTSDLQPQELMRLLDEQRRRIEALEARLTEIQQEMRSKDGVMRGSAADQEVAPISETEQPQPFEHAAGGAPPAEDDPASPAGDLPPARAIDVYGSLRVAAAWDARGHREVRNNGTRLGLRGQKGLIGQVIAFARVEVGVNMVANDRLIIQNADPGVPIGQGSQAIASRLGYVGLDTPVGNLSWGKQWSPYYDVAEFTDQFQIFSGFAGGAWAAGTDGGIVGTGRAERAFQYREARGPVGVALQVQSRSSSPNDRSWADAWGASAIIDAGRGFGLGAAYNQVRDGVAMPSPNEPQLGDEAALFGLRYHDDRWYVAGTYSILKQHEVDDLGRRFDGRGFELAVRCAITSRMWLEGGFNELDPDADHPGDYRVRLGLGNIVYRFGDASRVFFGVKVEGSRRSDGSRLAEHAVATGLNYTF